ncbi:MAG: PEP-CTERM system histidine kinase PrsK [Deltaproteobacteria bacterium]|jgi:putative PEP-CTERM system histidine kinase|nr:PEP-CTERM system histidine kinase PrsK [Deltaproteobacteria bacterium]
MLIPFFYTLNLLLLLSGLLGIRLNSGERRFSLALVQTLLGLPLLAGEYLYLVYHLEAQAVQVVLFSEIVFALIWLSMALRLRSATVATMRGPRLNFLIEIIVGAVVTAAAGYFLAYRSATEISNAILAFHHYSPIYFSAVFILMTVLYAAWHLEQFWRALNATRRWKYKFLVVGACLVCGALAWGASYRLTYLAIVPRHILLLAALLLFGWTLMSYTVVHHRLLNRKIFVSRKVVYSFVVPSLLAAYLLGFGLVSLIMRTFGLPLSFVLKWLFMALGFVGVGLFALSGKMRRRVHFFISTHFFINKYEYRDEWLALSQHLQGALTEADVVKALRQVLAESLYTTEIFIWLGDSSHGYRLVSSPENPDTGSNENGIASNDPLVRFIETHSHFHVKEKKPDQAWQKLSKNKEAFLTSLNLILLSPISVGNQLAGLIGLGPEFTGGQYGYDDFDLLTFLGSQTASALLAVHMAEKLAHTRERRAWNRLSAFVLHDIKNAATMLSLLRENAPDHIHEPEFQQDMLELVDDTLRRMDRVEQRLRTLKDEITPVRQNLELGLFLQVCWHRLKTKLASIEINIECKSEMQVNTDPELLFSILENLLLNAFEAGGEGTIVRIRTGRDDDGRQAVVEIIDNGPGIAEELLPDVLFEPFKTSKAGGSGIGLLQVKRMAASLGGSVSAENSPQGGARFVIRLPLTAGVG